MYVTYVQEKQKHIIPIKYIATQATKTYIKVTLVLPVVLTPSRPWCHLKMTNKSAKFETVNCFCLLFRTGMEKDFHRNTQHWKWCYRGAKYTVCMCVHASFSPTILQAWAVMGLILIWSHHESEFVQFYTVPQNTDADTGWQVAAAHWAKSTLMYLPI